MTPIFAWGLQLAPTNTYNLVEEMICQRTWLAN